VREKGRLVRGWREGALLFCWLTHNLAVKSNMVAKADLDDRWGRGLYFNKKACFQPQD